MLKCLVSASLLTFRPSRQKLLKGQKQTAPFSRTSPAATLTCHLLAPHEKRNFVSAHKKSDETNTAELFMFHGR